MTQYTVKYEIDINADDPKDAALQVERILKDMIYRPWLTVTDENGKSVNIDLDLEPERSNYDKTT